MGRSSLFVALVESAGCAAVVPTPPSVLLDCGEIDLDGDLYIGVPDYAEKVARDGDVDPEWLHSYLHWSDSVCAVSE